MVSVRANRLLGRFFMSTDTHAKKKKSSIREGLRTKAFWIAFEMIFVFGIPAVVAILLGHWLTEEGFFGDWVTYAALGLAFVVSWVIVYVRVRRLAVDMEAADDNGKDN